MELTKSPQRIAIVPGVDRSIEFEMENKGNAPINLTLQWETIDMEQDDSKPDRVRSPKLARLYEPVPAGWADQLDKLRIRNDT